MKNRKMPWKRKRHIIGILAVTVALCLFFCWKNHTPADGIAVYMILDLIYGALLICLLESSRLHGRLDESRSSDYRSLFFCSTAVCVILAVWSYLPHFTLPVALLAWFLGMAAQPFVAAEMGIFLSVIFGIATGSGFYELAGMCLLVLAGAQMSDTTADKEKRLSGLVILSSVQLAGWMVTAYLAEHTAHVNILLWNLISAAALVPAGLYLARRFYEVKRYARMDALEAIIAEDYPLRMEIKNYSPAEYVHAMKVSMIASKCAKEIGADDLLAAAGGFYYRLGILEGEPFIENGVRLAEQKCFPESVIQILAEYNGEYELPSTKESAIVHMVDACLKKVEMLNGHNLSTSWNQDMVIYQALNEFSATGIYDGSGISMNQFLKIRELLVREELGYDNHN